MIKKHLSRGAVALVLIAAAGASLPILIAGPVAAQTLVPAEPVTLTDAQRAKILRAIDLDRGASGPVGGERVIDEPSMPPGSSQPVGSAPPSSEITVGTAVPETLPLTPLPDSVVVQVPAVRRLSYAAVDGRLLLIDPATSMVLGEINK